MIKFLLVIFMFFILLVSLLGFSVIRSFKKMFFGSGNTSTRQQQTRASSNTGQKQQQQRASRTEESAQAKKKLFTKEDGEYVDYEEVK